MDRQEFSEHIRKMQVKLTNTEKEYWSLFTGFDSWQFWVIVAILLIPLIILLIKLDKGKNMWIYLFYGWSIHILFSYSDSFGVRVDLWSYPHSLIPYFPFSISFDAALVPVFYLLLYQWTVNTQKSFYLYSFLLSGILAFILKPFMLFVKLFELHGRMNYFYLFLIYCVIFLSAKLLTNFFIKIQKTKL